VPAEVPEAPAFLVGYALDEWHRVASELHSLKLLTVLEVQPLAAYCVSYSHWRTAEEALATTRPSVQRVRYRIMSARPLTLSSRS
jgi:P27 family predicted phage terminase small subunit